MIKYILSFILCVMCVVPLNAKIVTRTVTNYVPADLERADWYGECDVCGDEIVVRDLLYSPNTQYYYYPEGKLFRGNNIKCKHCIAKERQLKDELNVRNDIFLCFVFIGLTILFGMITNSMEKETNCEWKTYTLVTKVVACGLTGAIFAGIFTFILKIIIFIR